MTLVLKKPTNNEENLSKESNNTVEKLFTQMTNGNFANLDLDNYHHKIRFGIYIATSIGFNNEDTCDKMKEKLIDNGYSAEFYYDNLDHYSNLYRLRVWVTKKKILKEVDKWCKLCAEYMILNKDIVNDKSVNKLYSELDLKNNKIPTESTQSQFRNYLQNCIKLEKLQSQILKHTKYLKSLEKNYDIDSGYFVCIKEVCDKFHIE